VHRARWDGRDKKRVWPCSFCIVSVVPVAIREEVLCSAMNTPCAKRSIRDSKVASVACWQWREMSMIHRVRIFVDPHPPRSGTSRTHVKRRHANPEMIDHASRVLTPRNHEQAIGERGRGGGRMDVKDGPVAMGDERRLLRKSGDGIQTRDSDLGRKAIVKKSGVSGCAK
jgi:hypothetical protein